MYQGFYQRLIRRLGARRRRLTPRRCYTGAVLGSAVGNVFRRLLPGRNRSGARDAWVVNPQQIDGSEPSLTDTPAILILDLEADPRVVGAWLEQHPDTHIVAENEEALSQFVYTAARSTTLSSFTNGHPDAVDGFLSDVVAPFSNEFVAGLEQAFAGSPPARSFLAVQRAALNAAMRKRLTKPSLRTLMIQTVLRQNRDTPVVVAVGSAAFLANLRGGLADRSRPAPIGFMAATADPRVQRQIRETLDRIDADDTWPHAPPAPRHRAELDDALSAAFVAVDSRCDVPPAAGRCVFLIRWASKTVAATLRPVFMQSPADLQTVIICLDDDTTRDALAVEIRDIGATRPGSQLHVVSGRNRRPIEAQGVAASLARAIWAECGGSPCLTAHGLDLRPIAYDQVVRFARGRLWNLVHLHRLVGALLAAATRSVLVVAPGGHPRALAAQDSARALGCRSIDIEHAYMSTRYHYARPHGDIVTAIDQYSVDLFVEHFKVDPGAIRKIGTPRFDAIARLARTMRDAGDDGTGREPGRDRRLILFAAQPGRLEHNLRLLRLMAAVDAGVGPVQIVNKMHPSESDAVVDGYRERTSGATGHNIEVVREADINDLLQRADVVVTIFSSVGIEAAILGKKLIVANLDREELPLPLDRFGIGLTAYSDREFSDLLGGLLSGGDVVNTLTTLRGDFFRHNDHLRQGSSVERLWELINENLRSRGVAGRLDGSRPA